MRKFDYSKFENCLWDNEILRYLTQIHEHKGRQELFSRQKPVELEKLTEVAKVQSVESSNRIEGIITTSTRIGQIVKEKTTPKNRDEKEIAGYRDVLNTIHESHDYISITSNIILQLHRDLTKYSESGLGGTYKITQNYLKETRPDGSEFILHLVLKRYARIINRLPNPRRLIRFSLFLFLSMIFSVSTRSMTETAE